jgi:drug/metabolite transporter (DMT)-like permease
LKPETSNLNNPTLKQALIKMHLAVFLWGFTGILGKKIQLGEYPLVYYRMVLTSIILFIILKLVKEFSMPTRKQFLQLAGVGCIIAIHWVAFYGSIKYSNICVAMVCLSTSGIYIALLEPIFYKTKIKPNEILFSCVALLGMAFIYKFETQYTKGILFGLFSALLAAVFTLLNKKIVSQHPARLVAFYEISSGSFLLLLLWPLYIYYFPQIDSIPDLSDIFYLLLLSFFCTVLGQSLALSALKKLSSFTVVLTVNLEPVYGIILAFLFYHENKDLSQYFYIGIALIALSVGLHVWSMYRENKIPKV